MNKKGDLSINIIVIAAIALIVLVILSVLLFRSGGLLNRGTNCEGIGGQCIDGYSWSCREYAEYYSPGESLTKHPTAGCTREGDICCVKI